MRNWWGVGAVLVGEGVSPGPMRIWIGNDHPDSLITYPDNAPKMGLWVLAVLADGGVAWAGYSQ